MFLQKETLIMIMIIFIVKNTIQKYIAFNQPTLFKAMLFEQIKTKKI